METVINEVKKMRGFEIRMNYVKSFIAASIFGKDSKEAIELLEVIGDAYSLGRYDYQLGLVYDDVPEMFKGVEQLVDAWIQGMRDGNEAEIQLESQIEEDL